MIENQIEMYLHCGECVKDKPDFISPSDYQNISVGLVDDGQSIQIWCKNHEMNMAIFPLERPIEDAHCDCC